MPLRRRKPGMPTGLRPGIQRQAAARQRPRPTRQMQFRAAALGPRKLVRLSNFQRAATVQRRSWGRILLIGPLIELILNFIYRGRRFRTGVQRPKLRGMPASLGAKSQGKRILAEQKRKFDEERRQALELSQRRRVA